MRIIKEKTIRFPRKKARVKLAETKTAPKYRIYINRDLWDDLKTKREAKNRFKELVRFEKREAEKDWELHRIKENIKRKEEKKRRKKKRREKLRRVFGRKKRKK